MSVYGDLVGKARVKNFCKPLSYYGLHKNFQRIILLITQTILILVFRMFNVYGPGQDYHDKQGMVSIYLASILKKNKIIVKGSVKRYRDLIYRWYGYLIEGLKNKKMKNKIINLGTGQKTKVSQMLEILKKLHATKSEVIIKKKHQDQYGIYADKSIFELVNKKFFGY